jgi:hypothetical protein
MKFSNFFCRHNAKIRPKRTLLLGTDVKERVNAKRPETCQPFSVAIWWNTVAGLSMINCQFPVSPSK